MYVAIKKIKTEKKSNEAIASLHHAWSKILCLRFLWGHNFYDGGGFVQKADYALYKPKW